MSVTIEDDRIVVDEPDVDVNDFLEYAERAIERFGWRKGERKEVEDDDMVKVAEKEGLSLHDAIGYTNVMLGGDNPGTPTSKDSASTARTGSVRAMRAEMIRAISSVLPEGQTDLTFNDEAETEGQVLAVLREARGVTA